jgi:hypothetical protein
MWNYAHEKLRSIGLRGVFAGWTLSFMKDSFGSALFFGTFEYIKNQSYYSFLTHYYGSYESVFQLGSPPRQVQYSPEGRPLIQPHYVVEPAFLLLAGMSASVAQQVVVYPLTELQNVHFQRLEVLDLQAKKAATTQRMFRLYYHAYEKTYNECRIEVQRAGGWRRWLYRGFALNTLRQIPSTSAGLIVFELVRRKYSAETEAVRIEKDGYDILLT